MSTNGRLPNYINGQWRSSFAKEFTDVINPATGETLAQVPLDVEADVVAAIESAAAAFPEWRRTPPEERIQYLFKLKQLFEDHLEELASLVTTENGKTLTEARGELRRAIENVEVACGIPTLMQGYNLEDVARGIDEMMIRQPLGVVAAITPFNFPIMVPFWFIPYGIACGNTFIVKPSEKVPLTMKRLFELIEQLAARPMASGCSVRAEPRTMWLSFPMPTWKRRRRSSPIAPSAALDSVVWPFLSRSRSATQSTHSEMPSPRVQTQ